MAATNRFLRYVKRVLNSILLPYGFEINRRGADIYLHQYQSYDQYKDIQVSYNKKKIDRVWADKHTLSQVVNRVSIEFSSKNQLFGLCHGSRNGFEQSYLSDCLGCEVWGTDISDTATNFINSVQHDFHDARDEWVGKCNFIYTNSLDQSWQPKSALATWLDQLVSGGLIFIEHTRTHGTAGASEMDPFGVKPEYMPYVLADWFGHKISIEIWQGIKSNYNIPVWLFIIKKQ